MPLQTEPSDQASAHQTKPAVGFTACRLQEDTAPLINRLGDDRPAWLAAINLTAARHFLESDPPRLAGSRVSLLRLVNSLEQDRDGSDMIVAQGLPDALAMPADLDLRTVARRASAIAADLGQMIDGSTRDEATPFDLHAGLAAVRYSIQDLDSAIAAMLSGRCHFVA